MCKYTFAQQRNGLTTYFSGSFPFGKRRIRMLRLPLSQLLPKGIVLSVFTNTCWCSGLETNVSKVQTSKYKTVLQDVVPLISVVAAPAVTVEDKPTLDGHSLLKLFYMPRLYRRALLSNLRLLHRWKPRFSTSCFPVNVLSRGIRSGTLWPNSRLCAVWIGKHI